MLGGPDDGVRPLIPQAKPLIPSISGKAWIPATEWGIIQPRRFTPMKLSRYLLLVAIFGLVGTLGAKDADSTTAVLKTGTKLCIPCTAYCKAHPNAPRCN